MPSKLRLGLLLAFGAAAITVPAAAQDTPAARCSVAVNAQDLDGVIEACPAALEELPTDHPFYAHFQQTLDYAFGQRCTPAAQSQDWDSVLAYCVPAAAANPGLNFVIGLAYQAKQDWANAGPYFEMFVSAGGGQPEQVALAQRSGGIALARAGAPDRAIPLLQGAAQAKPDDVEVQYRLGVALLRTGDTVGGERALGAVIESAPAGNAARTQALFMAGQINHQAGDMAKAAERLGEYLSADPNGERAGDVHYMLGQALQGTDTAQAATHYRGFLDRAGNAADDPRVADAAYAAGTIYYNADDCANAETYYTRFIEVAPGDERAAQVQEILASIAEGACGG